MKNEYYKKGWGILVGKYSEEDLLKNKDVVDVSRMMDKYPKLKMINQKEIRENGKRKMEIYLCSNRDFKMRMW